MRLAFFFLVPFAVVASCGGKISDGSDAGIDAASGGPCSTNSDCPNGGDCAYPDNGGCSAQKQCFPPKKACKALFVCACDGTSISDDCNGGAPKPIAHVGVCEGPPSCSSGLACETCDLTAFAPVPQSPPFASINACTPSQITDFVAACIAATATQTTCEAWQKANAGPCASCAITPSSAIDWGPIVCSANGTCTLNDGGCVDLELKEVSLEKGAGGSGSCGDAYSDELGCIGYACAACTAADAKACSDSATVNECKSYVEVAKTSTLCGGLDATACFPQDTPDYAPFINVFCGTGP